MFIAVSSSEVKVNYRVELSSFICTGCPLDEALSLRASVVVWSMLAVVRLASPADGGTGLSWSTGENVLKKPLWKIQQYNKQTNKQNVKKCHKYQKM